MNPIYRILGLFARLSHITDKMVVHGPLNLYILGISAFGVYLDLYTKFWLTSLILFWLILVTLSIVSLSMLICLICCNVIFEPEHRRHTAVPQFASPESMTLRFSGILHQAFSDPKRVLFQPANFRFGSVIAVSADLTDDQFEGFGGSRKWPAIARRFETDMTQDTVEICRYGRQYFGLDCRPALRIAYVDTTDVKPRRRTAVVAFDSEEDRFLFVDTFTVMSGG